MESPSTPLLLGNPLPVFSVRYTCSLQQSPNKTYSVDVPWEETTDIPLTSDAVWSLVRSDRTLLEKLFDDDFPAYEDKSRFPSHYGEYLERINEAIYVKIDSVENHPKEPAIKGKRNMLKSKLKKVLRKPSNKDRFSTTFIRAYNKD